MCLYPGQCRSGDAIDLLVLMVIGVPRCNRHKVGEGKKTTVVHFTNFGKRIILFPPTLHNFLALQTGAKPKWLFNKLPRKKVHSGLIITYMPRLIIRLVHLLLRHPGLLETNFWFPTLARITNTRTMPSNRKHAVANRNMPPIHVYRVCTNWSTLDFQSLIYWYVEKYMYLYEQSKSTVSFCVVSFLLFTQCLEQLIPASPWSGTWGPDSHAYWNNTQQNQEQVAHDCVHWT